MTKPGVKDFFYLCMHSISVAGLYAFDCLCFKCCCRYSEQVECVIFEEGDLHLGGNKCHPALPL